MKGFIFYFHNKFESIIIILVEIIFEKNKIKSSKEIILCPDS